MSFFPIKYIITEINHEAFQQIKIAEKPEDIPTHVSFKVLETNINSWKVIFKRENAESLISTFPDKDLALAEVKRIKDLIKNPEVFFVDYNKHKILIW